MATTLIDRNHALAPSDATIGTSRCISHNLSQVRKAVRLCVQELPDMQELFRNAQRVLLKPNLLSSSHGPEAHVNTHPNVVQVIAELLIGDFHCDVTIGDSCGSMTPGSTARAFKNSGIAEAAAAVGARLYNVDAQPRHTARYDLGHVFKDIALPSNLTEFDLIVSIPKLKTHNLTCTTGAVKNMFGILPGAAKKEAHMLAPRVEEFCTLLCDLYELVKPGAAFVDGVIGMEGNGPANGQLRHMEMMAASCDGVALDSFCAEVMGFAPLSVPLLAQCQKRGLGVAAPADIAVRGETSSAFSVERFAKPATYVNSVILRMMPRWLLRGALGALTRHHAAINQQKCRRCGECAKNCPSHAISFDGPTRRYRVNAAECIACYCCAEVCPCDAIFVQGTVVRRVLRRVLGKKRHK